MGDSDWQRMMFSLSKLKDDGAIIINGPGTVSQQVKKQILAMLNLQNGMVSSPVFGELMIRVASKKTNHSNISTSISPKYDGEWCNVKLLKSFGVKDKNGHNNSLMTAFRYGPLQNPTKLWLQVKDKEILLKAISGTVGRWNKNRIFELFSKKSKILLLQYEKDDIGFHVESVKILYLNLEKLEFDLVELLKSGKITCESRMYIASNHQHCKTRGFKDGSLKNHGYGWRIKAPINHPIFTVINPL